MPNIPWLVTAAATTDADTTNWDLTECKDATLRDYCTQTRLAAWPYYFAQIPHGI